MSNILISKLPDSLEIDGRFYKIDADFRTAIRTLLAFEDPSLASIEKNLVLYENLYIEKPPDARGAILKGIWFLNGGKDQEEPDGPRLFSWAKDANLIYSAFHQTHHIDLESIPFLHWWKFLALFMDLGSDTAFCALVNLRKRVKTGKATKEERAEAREMGDMFTVDEIDDRTIEEIEAERKFLEMVNRRD